MKTGYALFALIGLGLIFDAPMWPKSSDVKPDDYGYIALNGEDSIRAIDSYKKSLHLNNTGFYKDFFPLSDQKLTSKTYVWFIVTYVTLIYVIFLWFKEVSEYSRDHVLMFLFIGMGNLIDFLLIYNGNYTKFITYNILSVAMYGIFLIYKGWKQNRLR